VKVSVKGQGVIKVPKPAAVGIFQTTGSAEVVHITFWLTSNDIILGAVPILSARFNAKSLELARLFIG
jgi:hypothetical protein